MCVCVYLFVYVIAMLGEGKRMCAFSHTLTYLVMLPSLAAGSSLLASPSGSLPPLPSLSVKRRLRHSERGPQLVTGA